ncbi:MAG TPA: AMP-binding protein, partial [Chloroflexota bacterium]|nr:AMP-binding protein [Chloroflexota bacterium]
MNVCDLLLDENVRQGRGEKTAVICPDRQATYRELVESTARLASGLASLGLQPEQRALIILPDSIEFVVAYLGVMRMGAVAVPLNTLLKAQDYQYLLDDSRARALIVHADYLPNIPLDSPWLKEIVVVGSQPAESGDERLRAWDAVLALGDPAYPALDLSPDDVGF